MGVLNNISIQSYACSNWFQNLSEFNLSFTHTATPPLRRYVRMYVLTFHLIALPGLAGSTEEHREVLCNEGAEEGCSD